MVMVEGTFRIADLETGRPHMDRMITASRAEPGCLEYAYAIDLLDPHLVRVVERWQSQDDLDRHLCSRHLQDWRNAWQTAGITNRSLRSYAAEPQVI